MSITTKTASGTSHPGRLFAPRCALAVCRAAPFLSEAAKKAADRFSRVASCPGDLRRDRPASKNQDPRTFQEFRILGAVPDDQFTCGGDIQEDVVKFSLYTDVYAASRIVQQDNVCVVDHGPAHERLLLVAATQLQDGPLCCGVAQVEPLSPGFSP